MWQCSKGNDTTAIFCRLAVHKNILNVAGERSNVLNVSRLVWTIYSHDGMFYRRG